MFKKNFGRITKLDEVKYQAPKFSEAFSHLTQTLAVDPEDLDAVELSSVAGSNCTLTKFFVKSDGIEKSIS